MAAARWAVLTVGSREARALASSILCAWCAPFLEGDHPRWRSTHGETCRSKRSRTQRRADHIRARDVRRPVRRYPAFRCLSSATVTSLTVSIAMGNHTAVTCNSGAGPAAPDGIVNGDSGLGICRRDLTSWQHRSSLYGRSLSCHRSCDFCQNFVTEAAIPSLALERHAGEERHA